jgi:hypothetical protein
VATNPEGLRFGMVVVPWDDFEHAAATLGFDYSPAGQQHVLAYGAGNQLAELFAGFGSRGAPTPDDPFAGRGWTRGVRHDARRIPAHARVAGRAPDAALRRAGVGTGERGRDRAWFRASWAVRRAVHGGLRGDPVRNAPVWCAMNPTPVPLMKPTATGKIVRNVDHANGLRRVTMPCVVLGTESEHVVV